MLALVHISSRHFVPDILEEARAEFPETVAPRDFDLVEIPLPERGGPELVPNGAREGRQPARRPGDPGRTGPWGEGEERDRTRRRGRRRDALAGAGRGARGEGELKFGGDDRPGSQDQADRRRAGPGDPRHLDGRDRLRRPVRDFRVSSRCARRSIARPDGFRDAGTALDSDGTYSARYKYDIKGKYKGKHKIAGKFSAEIVFRRNGHKYTTCTAEDRVHVNELKAN